MDGKILSFFLTALLSNLALVSGAGLSYRGAVVEYHPETGSNALETMNKNAQNFVKFMKQASLKKVDIIVFPEYGLNCDEASPIPDPVDGIIPCEDDSFKTTKAVKDLSCGSKDNKIYSVVNLREKRKCEENDPNCPPSGYYSIKTNVVFDRRGKVIARYAKYNLFKPTSDQPPKLEMSFFDTDFGVRFGIFICFDILFPTPAQRLVQQYGITDFVFSTFWYSELPFLSALQAQRGWAETNNVNLLAAGMNQPDTGSSGSGIYNGKFGEIVQIMPEKITSRLLVADIPKINRCNTCQRDAPLISELVHRSPRSVNFTATHQSVVEESVTQFKLTQDPSLPGVTSEVIKGGEKFEKTICTKTNFCCDFKVTMDALAEKSKNYTYRAVVFNGVRPFGTMFRGGVQTCAVIVCLGPEIKDCGKRDKKIQKLFKFKEILIKGNFKRKNSFLMPSTLTDGDGLKPLSANKYEFIRTEKDKHTEASLELLWPAIDLHTFAIWGRDFTRDNETSVLESGASVAMSAPILFLSFISFILFAR